jgi:hypothetical protein
METAFGRDFGGVRVHEDGNAATSARALGARAYSVGSDIVLGADARHDDAVLAHELAHVVQQPAAPPSGLRLGRSDDPAEHEAERAGASVARGRASGALSSQPPGVVRRQPLHGRPCPGCHAPTGIQNISLEGFRGDDQHYLPENALEFYGYLRKGWTWTEYKGCKQTHAEVIRVAEFGGGAYIAGYVIYFTNPKGSAFSWPAVTVDVYGNKIDEKWFDPEALESVMSPIDFIGPAFLERLGASAIRGATSGLARLAIRGRAALGSAARSTMIAGRLYTGAAMRGLGEAGSFSVSGGALESSGFVVRSGGELATGFQEARALTEFAPSVSTAPRAATAGSEVEVAGPSFADVSAELQLEVPGTIRYRSTAAAAGAARRFGLESTTRPGFQTHATASTVRGEFGVTGRAFQSAHVVPQAVYRALRVAGRRVSEGRALTTLLPTPAHAAFDRTWVAEWNAAVGAGQAIRAGDVYRMVSRAIRAVDERIINAQTKAAIEDRLATELFDELGLSANDVIVPARP